MKFFLKTFLTIFFFPLFFNQEERDKSSTIQTIPNSDSDSKDSFTNGVNGKKTKKLKNGAKMLK